MPYIVHMTFVFPVSRYADPVARGWMPVFKTAMKTVKCVCIYYQELMSSSKGFNEVNSSTIGSHSHMLRISFVFLPSLLEPSGLSWDGRRNKGLFVHALW